MKISSFLAIVTFCCLLFMEYDPDEQKAYHKLGLDLDELYIKLRKLHDSIGAHNATAVETINTISSEVMKAKESLNHKDHPTIKKHISIEQSLKEVEEDTTKFSTKYSSDELNKLVGKIEQIWKGQIQTKCSEAME
jgi:hypothetical protein